MDTPIPLFDNDEIFSDWNFLAFIEAIDAADVGLQVHHQPLRGPCNQTGLERPHHTLSASYRTHGQDDANHDEITNGLANRSYTSDWEV